MKPERRRNALLVGLLAVAVAGAFWSMRDPSPSPAAAAPARSSSASRPARSEAPAVTVDTLPVVDLGVGRGTDLAPAVERDVFRFHDPPTPTPPPPTPTPTPFPAQGSGAFVGPMLPTPTPTPTPIVPPQIPYKLLGLFGPKDRPILAMEDGGRLIVAREGDVLDGRFVLKKLNRESVDFGFVGLPPHITRRLPLAS